MENTNTFPRVFTESAPLGFDTANALLQVLPAAVYTCDNEGMITFFNKEAEKLWGCTPVTGQDKWCGALKVYNEEGVALTYNETPVAVALRERLDVTGTEIIIERADGTLRQVVPTIKLLYDASGFPTGAVTVFADSIIKTSEGNLLADDATYKSLSELLEHKIEERTATLKKSEERYHKMVEEVQDYAIVLLDTEGYILNWNLGAEKIKGYTEKEIIGKNFRIFYLDHDRETKLPEKLIQRAHDTGRAMHEGWRMRKDGTTFWGSIVITALHNDANDIIGFSKVTRDLTERKLADDRMADYAKDIEFRNKQLEEYAYIASHDLQEPLRKIQVFTELLEEDIDDKDAIMRNLGKIKKASIRMTNLIKDVLKYSQLSRADELFEAIDLSAVLAAVTEDFDLLTEQKNITIKHTVLPVITGIPIQLHQLFSNLLSNAIKFSSENPLIEIFTEAVHPDDITALPRLIANRDYIKILFKDNGVGFNQQYSDQIFKMFKRLTDNSGTGIGLALCKKITENHNGYIAVTSEVGKGTTFTIILPVNGGKSK
jgi:PAS domain S-box-containing protein